jgi:hypothetical protein
MNGMTNFASFFFFFFDHLVFFSKETQGGSCCCCMQTIFGIPTFFIPSVLVARRDRVITREGKNQRNWAVVASLFLSI